MLKNIKYFLPSYKECWIIVLCICVVGGLGFGLLLALIAAQAGMTLADINPLISYIVPFIPAFAYIIYKGNQTAKNNLLAETKGLTDRIVAPVPLNMPDFGHTNPILTIILLVLATLCSMIVLEPLAALIPMPAALKQVYSQMITDSLWTSLAVVVAAPLLEEFVVRGIMLRGLLKHTTPLVAIIWSSMFFALIHMNLYQALTAFLIGAFMGWIYYKTRSLWLTILIHFVNNGTSTLFTILFPDQNVETTLMEMITQYAGVEKYIALYAVCSICFAAILYYFNKTLTYEQGSKTISL